MDIDGRTTQSGKKQGERAARIKKYATDMPLSDFGLDEIDAIIQKLDWSKVERDHIKGLRPKTKVYGEFKLWEMTRQALGTTKKKGPVFVTTSGASLIAPTESNNKSARIPSARYKLLDRVQRHQPEFRRLGFHHLRKTAANQVRKIAEGETMGVFLRHGQPVKADALAAACSNPVFAKVFDAQDKLWELWKDISTPLEVVELLRKLSPEAVQQIRLLKKQGVQTKKLAEMFGVCADTIRVHCRKKK